MQEITTIPFLIQLSHCVGGETMRTQTTTTQNISLCPKPTDNQGLSDHRALHRSRPEVHFS